MVQDIAEIEMFATLYLDKQQTNDSEKINESVYFNLFNIESKPQQVTQQFEPVFCDKQAMHVIPVPETTLTNNNQNNNNIQNESDTNQQVRCGELDISINDSLQNIAPQLQKNKIFNVNGNLNQFPAIVNFYQPDEKNMPKLHDIIDCYGILNYEIISNDDIMEMEEQLQMEQSFSNNYLNQYPVQIVPRIDVIYYEIQQNPLELKLNQLKNSLNLSNNDKESQENLKQNSYNTIISILKEICLDDDIIAHYLMISFIANTLFQKDGINFGKMVVNIFKIPESSFVYKLGTQKLRFSQVIDIIAQIVIPFVQSYPLSIPFLSENKMGPNKNNETEKFEHGILQIPQKLKHLLIFDETYMESGNLNEQGVKNIMILNKVLDSQILDVQNEFFNLQLEANVTGLILSEGKSFIYNDLKVCFKERQKNGEIILSENVQKLIENKDDKLQQQLQYFFLDCRLKLQDVQITEQAKLSIEKDYIDERQKQQQMDQNSLIQEEKITPDSLQRWIQLSKIMASYKFYEKKINLTDKIEVQASDYQFVRYLENERILRLK